MRSGVGHVNPRSTSHVGSVMRGLNYTEDVQVSAT